MAEQWTERASFFHHQPCCLIQTFPSPSYVLASAEFNVTDEPCLSKDHVVIQHVSKVKQGMHVNVEVSHEIEADCRRWQPLRSQVTNGRSA